MKGRRLIWSSVSKYHLLLILLVGIADPVLSAEVSISTDAQGRMLVSSYEINSDSAILRIMRYNTDGSIDTTYGKDHDGDGVPDGYLTVQFTTHSADYTVECCSTLDLTVPDQTNPPRGFISAIRNNPKLIADYIHSILGDAPETNTGQKEELDKVVEFIYSL